GSQKLKCGGEHPLCSRCARRGLECIYMKRRQMGRPKKFKDAANAPVWEDNARSATPTMSIGSLLNSSEVSDGSGEESHNGFHPSLANSPEFDDELGTGRTGLTARRPAETLRSSQLDSVQGDPISRRDSGAATISARGGTAQACACISRLSLALENLRCRESTDFHSSLCVLRRCMAIAREVLVCQMCPVHYDSAMQNAQVLATLMMSIAEQFRRIVWQIEGEEKRASAARERKTVQLSSCDMTPESIDDSDWEDCVSFQVEPGEWKCLLKKAVRAEIFGLKDGSHPCYALLLEGFETRLRGWHHAHPSSDWPTISHRQAIENGEPSCLKLLESSRRVIEPLQFDCIDL
ncbi:hypothetical protein P152DRAFT_385080, partial [Eremomyces bilateralis CBS 781.70]